MTDEQWRPTPMTDTDPIEWKEIAMTFPDGQPMMFAVARPAQVARVTALTEELEPVRVGHGTVTHMMADWDQLVDDNDRYQGAIKSAIHDLDHGVPSGLVADALSRTPGLGSVHR